MRNQLLFLLVLSIAFGCVKVSDETSTPPNIIFIMSDDHAAKAISAYDDRLVPTPNIDRIADEGAIFNNSFVTNSICAPSRAVLLTGRYSHKNGVLDNKTPFDSSQVTFPKLLQGKGFQTALVGKWHLKSQPSGFHYWNVLPGQGDYMNPQFIENGDSVKYTGYVTDIITDLSIQWLDQRDKSKPFCLLTHHKAAHTPNIPPEKYKGLYEERTIPLPANFYDDYEGRDAAKIQRIAFDNERPFFPYHYRKIPKGTPKDSIAYTKYQTVMQDYLAVIRSLDDNVGRLLDYLDQNGLADNTLVVYTSDQGFFLGEHGWFNKRFMYEESIKMPLVARMPKMIEAGTQVNEMVLNIDFAPTFLDLAGASIPTEIQGTSMLPLFEKTTLPNDWREAMYYHYYDLIRFGNIQKHYGIRTDRYKLIHFYEEIDEWELYDLKNDPTELNNIYGSSNHSAIEKDLKQELLILMDEYDEKLTFEF